jgi:hypothetical protein
MDRAGELEQLARSAIEILQRVRGPLSGTP